MLKTVHETFSQKFLDVCISSSEESDFNFNSSSSGLAGTFWCKKVLCKEQAREI